MPFAGKLHTNYVPSNAADPHSNCRQSLTSTVPAPRSLPCAICPTHPSPIAACSTSPRCTGVMHYIYGSPWRTAIHLLPRFYGRTPTPEHRSNSQQIQGWIYKCGSQSWIAHSRTGAPCVPRRAAMPHMQTRPRIREALCICGITLLAHLPSIRFHPCNAPALSSKHAAGSDENTLLHPRSCPPYLRPSIARTPFMPASQVAFIWVPDALLRRLCTCAFAFAFFVQLFRSPSLTTRIPRCDAAHTDPRAFARCFATASEPRELLTCDESRSHCVPRFLGSQQPRPATG
ncbi:hypothetical protein C8R44DRAFT_889352 [Mycena epipterygia]|nr:hypothetical protein C8R44DRAFT_889352 [Mycena epipterygia]